MTSSTFVVGGTGTLGSLVAPEILKRGGSVRSLVRNEDRARELPDGVEPFVGDLTDSDRIRVGLKGMDSVLYVQPHMPNDRAVGTAFVRATETAGARLVFTGAILPPPEMREGFLQLAPAYRGKVDVAAAAAESDTNPVLIDLSNFAQNDEIFREDILAGVYPMPIHQDGFNRVDLRDAAEVAARALLEPDFAAGQYSLRGTESPNGPESARVWSEALGREVRYLRDGEDWKAFFTKRLTGQKLADCIMSWEVIISQMPNHVEPEGLESVARLLGRAPRGYSDYVKDAAQRWTS